MDTARLKRLFDKYLPPEFSDFKMNGRVAAQVPVGQVMRGFFFDRMRNADSVALFVFVQPLYVPAASADMRLGGNLLRLSVSQPGEVDAMGRILTAMRRERSFVDRFPDPAAVVNNTASTKWSSKSKELLLTEYIAYSELMTEQYAHATRSLRLLVRLCDERMREVPPSIPRKYTGLYLSKVEAGFLPMKERAEILLRNVSNDVNSVRDLLRMWEEGTRTNLKIREP